MELCCSEGAAAHARCNNIAAVVQCEACMHRATAQRDVSSAMQQQLVPAVASAPPGPALAGEGSTTNSHRRTSRGSGAQTL